MAEEHRNSSFSYKSIHPEIKKVLDARSDLTNRTQMAMPFIKATTTLNGAALRNYGLTGDMFGFTLGLHATRQDAKFEDIYGDQTGNALVGYTYVNTLTAASDEGGTATNRTSTQYIYAKSSGDAFLDKSAALITDPPTQAGRRIPPPGITSVTIGRIKNGVVSSADINFVVPTIEQLEMLHRTFLVPGIGMILEWGQEFSAEPNPSFGENGFSGDTDKMFPWFNRPALSTILDRLGKNQIGLDEIMNCYVHKTEGQYQWIFGRVSNFTTKANGDGSYDCMVKIVGPAEDSWAYSVRNTAVPSTAARTGGVCSPGASSVETYFTKTTTSTNPINFFTVLDNMAKVPGRPADATVARLLPDWEGHVLKLIQGNQSGTAGAASTAAAAGGDTFGDNEDAYYISWRFFVNVILNHQTYGLKSIFASANLSPEDLVKISILRPYGTTSLDMQGDQYINDPYENFVGNNKFLRSTDINSLIIVNATAATEAENYLRQNHPSLTGPATQRTGAGAGGNAISITVQTNSITAITDEITAFNDKGDFFTSDQAVRTANNEVCPVENDRGLLSAGVWLNHKMIVQAMASADTITAGLTNVLNRMNAATSNFWNLTLDVSEPIKDTCGGNSSTDTISYTVTDMNYRESSDKAVKDFIATVHTFNKRIRQADTTRVGSDVIDCTVDMNLPKRMFSQIATLGLSQPAEGNTGNAEHSAIVGDNDALREMFGITQLSNQRTGISADLTAPFRSRFAAAGPCGQSNNTPSVGVGGGSTPGSANQLTAANTADKITILEKYQLLNICLTDGCTQRAASVDREFIPVVREFAPGALGTIGANAPNMDPIRAGQPTTFDLVFTPSRSKPSKGVVAGQVYRERINLPTNRILRNGSVAGELNAAVPIAKMTVITGNSRVVVPPSPRASYNGKMLLENTAAGWFQKLIDYAAANNCPRFTISSAYRDLQHQAEIKTLSSGGAAAVGGSPHGQGLAIDIGELYALASDGSTDPAINARVRQTSDLYNWLSANAPAFGWYNPRRLRDSAGVDECWHWEFWGYPGMQNGGGVPTGTPGAAPAAAPAPSPTPRPTPTATAKLTEEITGPQAVNDAAQKLAIGAEAITLGVGGITEAPDNCDECLRQRRELTQLRASLANKNQVEAAASSARQQSPNLSQIFRYQEIFPDQMVANITGTADGVKSNAFGASPGSLSINAELTLPGINGLRVGELFWIDRIPAFYRAFGAFQIMNIQDVIGQDGWTTKISAKFNYLGTEWKKRSLEILS